MNRRVTTVLFFALLISAAATFVVYRLIGDQIAGNKRARTSKVLVASRNLELGSIIKEADLREGEWVGAAAKGMAARPEMVLGRGVVSTIYEGEPILESRLAPAGSGGGLAATIPPGMRAAAVRVDEVVGVAGFVVPGMRVDVIISGTPPGGDRSGGSRVKTLLQNIEVLSAGTNIQKDAEGKPVQVQVVNLLVAPEQAELLSLASAETRIQLVLRNPLDTKVVDTKGNATAALFGEAAPAPTKPVAAAPRPKRAPVVAVAAPPQQPLTPGFYMVEVLNGAKRSEAKFSKSDDSEGQQQ